MTVGNSHGGHCFSPQDGRHWRSVASCDLTVFYRAVAHTVCQLPADWSLLLQPADDGRTAELVARPEPAFRVWRRSNLLVDLRPRNIVEMVRHLEQSLLEHWEVTRPQQLVYAFDPRDSLPLRRALLDPLFASERLEEQPWFDELPTGPVGMLQLFWEIELEEEWDRRRRQRQERSRRV